MRDIQDIILLAESIMDDAAAVGSFEALGALEEVARMLAKAAGDRSTAVARRLQGRIAEAQQSESLADVWLQKAVSVARDAGKQELKAKLVGPAGERLLARISGEME
jgi:hypothetical protein